MDDTPVYKAMRRFHDLVIKKLQDEPITDRDIEKARTMLNDHDFVAYRVYFSDIVKKAITLEKCISLIVLNKFETSYCPASVALASDNAAQGLTDTDKIAAMFNMVTHTTVDESEAYVVYHEAARQLLQDYILYAHYRQMIRDKGLPYAVADLDDRAYHHVFADKRTPLDKKLDRLTFMHDGFERLTLHFARFFEVCDEELQKDFLLLFGWAKILDRLYRKLFNEAEDENALVELSVNFTDLIEDTEHQMIIGLGASERLKAMIDRVSHGAPVQMSVL